MADVLWVCTTVAHVRSLYCRVVPNVLQY